MMIDINNTNNFELQLPPLKQKCDLSVTLKKTSSNPINKSTKDSTLKTATTKPQPQHYSGSGSALGGVEQKKRNSATPAIIKKSLNSVNLVNPLNPLNPVCAANRNFFLISAYKDQNFLKKECELARLQVVSRAAERTTQKEATEANAEAKQQQQQQQHKAACVKCNDSNNNNNNNNTSSSNDSSNTTHTSSVSKFAAKSLKALKPHGRRFDYNGMSTASSSLAAASRVAAPAAPVAVSKTNGFVDESAPPLACNCHAQNAKITKVSGFNAVSSTTATTTTITPANSKSMQKSGFGSALITNSAIKLPNNNNSNLNHNHNHNNNNNNNNMQQQQFLHTQDDDIKYIDSDEQTLAATPECNPLPAPPRCCQIAAHAAATQLQQHATSGGGRIKSRPKSTIICSTTSAGQRNQVFEKVASYKYATGSSLSELRSSPAATERRRELKSNIDSSSIKASIEKFNNLSEQKRLPLPLNTLRSQTAKGSSGSSGSTNNLQHHRYSSDFSDAYNAKLSSVVGGGSLTRTTMRNFPTAAANTPAVNKVVTNIYTSNVSSTSSSPVAVKARISSISHPNSSNSSCSSSYNKSLDGALASSTSALAQRTSLSHSKETNGNGTNYNSNHLLNAQKEHHHQHTKSSSANVHQHAPTDSTASECNENKLLNSCDNDDSVRTSTAFRSALPPPSPTPSRYGDRESYTRTRTDENSTSKDEKSEGLCGLRNIGNTCFMNSVIQCLSHTSELTKFLRTQNGVKSSSSKDQQILYEFAKLIREMWTQNVHSVTPMELKRAFSAKHRMYSDYNQQDAQEFLRFFLDSLHSALNTGVKGGEHLKLDDNYSDNKKADLTWEWYSRHENSLIRDLFVGQLKSTLKCTTCGNTSVTFDPFWDLSVPLPSSSRCKLDACLDLFIREEILDGDEMPTCSKCQTRRRCTKSFSIQRFPKYLVIHLKRFSETRWSKLSNIVEFPTGERELNMGSYGANHNTNVCYSLYAISNHMGSTAGGHYVALCKHPYSKKWHEFNDNIVSDDLSEHHLVSSSAYILFYERA